MFYVDSQKTVTRRDSSLIVDRAAAGDDFDIDYLHNARNSSPTHHSKDSTTTNCIPTRRSCRQELITTMFDSMLVHIVESWEVIPDKIKSTEIKNNTDGDNTENTTVGSKGKKKLGISNSKGRSPSRATTLSSEHGGQCPSTTSLYPEERAVIRFHNGNVYEGSLSMKIMNGNGRFQWADGTIYIGKFNDSKITGRGVIYWKDDSWYEGEFFNNVRHGTGTYVESRNQKAYIGQWYLGTKHGEGTIYFGGGSFRNSYVGEWSYNLRHGFGIREYCYYSGYRGDWECNVRDGKGLMIWPNHDLYIGGWKNGLMSDYGVYVWDNHIHNTMVLPNLNMYRGQWHRGKRNGFGMMYLQLINGCLYKGEFKDNRKNGSGKFITNSGLVISCADLFDEDVFAFHIEEPANNQTRSKIFNFQLCDVYYGLMDTIQQAINKFDTEEYILNSIIEDYIEKNKLKFKTQLCQSMCSSQYEVEVLLHHNIEDYITFEREALRKVIHYYEKQLKCIYYQYSTACASKPINFISVMIRLYLWQFFYDCKIMEFGLTMVDIDNMIYKRPELLARTAHNPFEKVYFWQFVHILITVAIHLFAEKAMPEKKPETVVTEAFRTFMDTIVTDSVGMFRGNFMSGYGWMLPLRPLYELYFKIGEPHTIRQFLLATRHSYTKGIQPDLMDATDDEIPCGHNGYILADELTFITEYPLPEPRDSEYDKIHADGLLLYNLGNLTSETILRAFHDIIPNVYCKQTDKLQTIDIQITFYEFLEVLVNCMQESIRIMSAH